MRTEPIIYRDSVAVGDLMVEFKGEQWGDKIQDTEVKIGDSLLCWISWETKDEFITELSAVVNKHRI